MRFEGRDLKPYAEPVTSSMLKEGRVYFAVNFIDRQMLVPEMEALVFVGRNLDPGDAGRVYFQDFDSYQRGIHYGTETEEDVHVYVGSENEISHIFEYESAIDVLLRCAIRRAGGAGA